ncbi:hypothetical protein [Delftia acidovorans]|uniref:Uncharacterized protein n=1 Tax=Delftia acidovorans TaxID=80866 RepID=A0AAJ2VCX8_DELAC|nr:hypothetical protein [Delftia acidovorans]MDX4957826.1 hypothetical protein [Delftia acidovorans]
MPLTVYSKFSEKESDVEQVLRRLSAQFGEQVTSIDKVPDHWREFMRQDLQCPSCFVTGAEVVREAVSSKTKKPLRQAFFRFSNPRHREYCDFDNSDYSNSEPENLISFNDSKTKVTRAIRELVCTGIELGIFSQRSIRDMREWFFKKKIQSMFVVALDARFPYWINELYYEAYKAKQGLPEGVSLTAEIAALHGFSLRAEVARQQILRHPSYQEFMHELDKRRFNFFGVIEQLASICRRYQGRSAFDPSSLEAEYKKTCELSEFVANNYSPLKDSKIKGNFVSSALAFSALLLFVRDWEVELALKDFSIIAARAGSSDTDLGNVMGLNPFHNYAAWKALKQVQEFKIIVPDYTDLKAERKTIDAEIRAMFGL